MIILDELDESLYDYYVQLIGYQDSGSGKWHEICDVLNLYPNYLTMLPTRMVSTTKYEDVFAPQRAAKSLYESLKSILSRSGDLSSSKFYLNLSIVSMTTSSGDNIQLKSVLSSLPFPLYYYSYQLSYHSWKFDLATSFHLLNDL
uniref:Uncharacterized protein n=1 Tax=Rhizophagus irregularis (strain DAOM 181602 / DAOM 197198 / MUCL 43194) TaxID=747089 RepID=U9SN86_RHIID